MSSIKYNKVGKSDIFVSEMTLGCMSLDNENIKSNQIIDYALNQGINHLDTADLYQFGLNESMIGQAIKSRRNEIILSSKVGNQFDFNSKKVTWNPTRQHIINGIKASLSRLNTDYLDFYLLHGGTIEDNTEETIDAFEHLKKAGLIRAYGISSIRPNVINRFIKLSNIDVVMMQYSLLDRRPEYALLDELNKHQISVFARGSLAKGILTHNSKKRNNLEPYLTYNQTELKSIINQLVTEFDLSLQEIALRFTLKHPAVVSNVVGVSTLEQLIENLNAIDAQLTDFDYQKIKKLTHLKNYTKHL